MAVSEYILLPDRIIFSYTEVPKVFAGRGVGKALAKTGLDWARENKLKVMPLCPFFAQYIKRLSEYHDMLMPGFRVK